MGWFTLNTAVLVQVFVSIQPVCLGPRWPAGHHHQPVWKSLQHSTCLHGKGGMLSEGRAPGIHKSLNKLPDNLLFEAGFFEVCRKRRPCNCLCVMLPAFYLFVFCPNKWMVQCWNSLAELRTPLVPEGACRTPGRTQASRTHMFGLFILFEIYKRPSYLELEHS